MERQRFVGAPERWSSRPSLLGFGLAGRDETGASIPSLGIGRLSPSGPIDNAEGRAQGDPKANIAEKRAEYHAERRAENNAHAEPVRFHGVKVARPKRGRNAGKRLQDFRSEERRGGKEW